MDYLDRADQQQYSKELSVAPAPYSEIEQVVIMGDLSKLTPPQRVQYYNAVCKSVGLNPMTRPFDYITLNGKLTLYARKDATDQLRQINGVSIDDVQITESDTEYTVITKGHDARGRSDVEIGVVSKKDMQGNAANAKMKAVTKSKRRLTLSLCGLGWLDETELETIPDVKMVQVKDDGVIVGQTRLVSASSPAPTPTETYPMTPELAFRETDSIGVLYKDYAPDALESLVGALEKKIKREQDADALSNLQFKLAAANTIRQYRANHPGEA